MGSIGVIVLAAGGSSRLGRPKQLVDWDGRPLLERVIRSVDEWPASRIVVVLGSRSDAILEVVDIGDASVVVNRSWQDGLASSLTVGLEAMERFDEVEWCFIALGDQPRIDSAVPIALAAAATPDRPVVVPSYRGTRSNPALVHRSLWPRLMVLAGDAGAAGLFAAHPEWVKEVEVDAPPPADIDTDDDLDALRERPR